MFSFYMIEGDPIPWPELDTWHQCRNFDRIREWTMANSVGRMEESLGLTE